MTPKIPAKKILSDECSINIGRVIENEEIVDEGQDYFIHKGEWVEIVPVMSVKEVLQLSRLQNTVDGQFGNSLQELCVQLSKRILAWNWTDLSGEPLPQPFNHPEILEDLSSDELLWLVNATGVSESADDRKKDSGQLELTS